MSDEARRGPKPREMPGITWMFHNISYANRRRERRATGFEPGGPACSKTAGPA